MHKVIIYPHQSVQYQVNMFCKLFVRGGDDYIVRMITSDGNYIHLVAGLSFTILVWPHGCIFLEWEDVWVKTAVYNSHH